MTYKVQFTPHAAAQLRGLKAADMARVSDHCQRILTANPRLASKSRVKRLRGGVFPPYRLRVDDYRVFYDVNEAGQSVMIYGVVSKAQADEWLAAQQEEREDENG